MALEGAPALRALDLSPDFLSDSILTLDSNSTRLAFLPWHSVLGLPRALILGPAQRESQSFSFLA